MLTYGRKKRIGIQKKPMDQLKDEIKDDVRFKDIYNEIVK